MKYPTLLYNIFDLSHVSYKLCWIIFNYVGSLILLYTPLPPIIIVKTLMVDVTKAVRYGIELAIAIYLCDHHWKVKIRSHSFQKPKDSYL